MSNQGQPPAQQQQQAAGAANQQQQQAAGAANQQLTQQHQSGVGQATNASAGSLASYETVERDQGVGNNVGKYKNL